MVERAASTSLAALFIFVIDTNNHHWGYLGQLLTFRARLLEETGFIFF
jgi:hypothetical protein